MNCVSRGRLAHPEKANELYLSFADPRGFTADEYLIPVGRQVQNELQALPTASTRLKEKKDRYVITGKDFSCEISRVSGQILSVKKGKKEIERWTVADGLAVDRWRMLPES